MKIVRESYGIYRTYRLDPDDAEYLLNEVADLLNQQIKNVWTNVSVDTKQDMIILKGLPDVKYNIKEEQAQKSFIDTILGGILNYNTVEYEIQCLKDGAALIIFNFLPIDLVKYYFR